MARRRPQIAVPIVLDASITASWHFEEERSAAADTVLDSLTQDTALAPLLWWFEIRNVLVLGERRRRATAEQTATFLDFLSRLPIRIDSLPDQTRVFDLSRTHGLTFYDASYLELALRAEIGLATLDKALTRAASAEGVGLIVDAP